MSNNTAAAGSPRKPTEKEAFFFLTILNSMKNKPEVSWDPLPASLILTLAIRRIYLTLQNHSTPSRKIDIVASYPSINAFPLYFIFLKSSRHLLISIYRLIGIVLLPVLATPMVSAQRLASVRSSAR
jgi:hypothetical protein